MRTRFRWSLLLCLAGLSAAAPPQPVPIEHQVPKHFAAQIKVTAKLDYLLFLPEGYAKSRQRWPLLLFLHGAGESGTNLAKLPTLGPPRIVESKPDFPFILISPQTTREGWNPDTLNALLDDVLRRYRVDKDRVYLTGASMGGSGTWRMAAAHPDRFAAIAPVCGRGDPADAPKLAHLPIWVFQGAKDPVVHLDSAKAMVEAVQAAGGNVKFTVYPDAGHDAWTATYSNPELYQWFLAQKRQH